MKKSTFKILFSILFCGLFCLTSFGQWTSQTPVLAKQQGILALNIAPNNPNVAWGLGMKFTVLTQSFSIGIPGDCLTNLAVVRTTDGGVTWTATETPAGSCLYPSNITVISDTEAWVSYVELQSQGNYVYKTTDGGQTWSKKLQSAFLGVGGFVDFVHFFDAQNGVALGDPTTYGPGSTPYFEIWTTSDGGSSWGRIASANIPAPLANEVGLQANNGVFDAIDGTLWSITLNTSTNPVTPYRLLRTKDMGKNWQVFNIPANLYGISFANAQSGIALQGSWQPGEGKANSPIFRTTDGGETWTQSGNMGPKLPTSIELVPGTSSIIATVRTDNASGYATQISHDWGQTWIDLGTSDDFVACLSFASPTVGYGGDWQRVPSKPFKMYKYSGSPVLGLISEKKLDAEVSIYPNPTADFVKIEFKNTKNEPMWVLLNDAQGRLIEKKTIESTENGTVSFDLKNQPAGVYQLTLSSATGVLTRSVVRI
jgi:photosystem II stability/assembly factor-like uncharacterized protein